MLNTILFRTLFLKVFHWEAVISMPPSLTKQMEPDNMLNFPYFPLHLFVKLAFVEEMDIFIILPHHLPVNSQHKSRSLPEPAFCVT